MLSFEKETEKFLKSIDFLLDTDYNYKRCKYAGMAELADALDSGSNGRKAVQVQVLLPAPNENPFSFEDGFLFVLFNIHFSSFNIH